MSILSELRRRNVFKVGAAYAIVAWLLVQVVDVVLPALQMPEWTISFVTVLLIIGFPITLIMAWAYEMTPEGIKAAADVPRDSITPATGQRFNYFIVGLLVLAVGFLVTDQYVLDQGMQASVVGTSRSTVTVPLGGGSSLPSQSTPSLAVQRLTIELGETIGLGQEGLGAELAISPDGSRLVYATNAGGRFQLHMRLLDQFEAQPMPGTEVARMPFFSPNGEWVGYVSGMGTLIKKVSVRGGPPQTLAEGAATPYGGVWGTDNTIIYSSAYAGGGRLMQVSALGGVAEILAAPESDTAYTWPQILPGGTAVLLTSRGISAPASEGSIVVLSLDTGELLPLIPGAFNARYAPTGHIVFARTGSLWAVPFDAERLEIRGTPAPMVNGVEMNSRTGHVPYDFSDDGLLVYVRGNDKFELGAVRGLVWVDREGQEEPLDVPPRAYLHPRVSPDGQRLAVTVGSIAENSTQDVWVYDLERGTESRLTFDSEAAEMRPVWTPDGESIVYYSARAESGIFRKAANGTGREERLTTSAFPQHPEFFSTDGSQLVFRTNPNGNFDLHSLSMEGERASTPVLEMGFDEAFTALSPDGRWIAYSSNETGTYEVYVRPFPNVEDGRWQISTAGGASPRWGPDGRELFYRIGGTVNTALMAVNVEADDSIFSPGVPARLFTGAYFWSAAAVPNYDISSDGRRFLMMSGPVQGGGSSVSTSIAIVSNWFEELERLAPPAQ